MDLDKWFGFTLRERKGIGALLVIMVLLFFIVEYWTSGNRHDIPDVSGYLFPVDSLKDDQVLDANQMTQDFALSKDVRTAKYLKFNFNPNTISYDSLLLLGFSKYAAKNLVNYVAKGGKIYDSGKLKTIYGVDTDLINQLVGFIHYPEKPTKPDYKNNYPKRTYTDNFPTEPLELNTADTAALFAFKLIGKYHGKKIVSFREKSGGFMNKEQLVEFGIFSDSLYQLIEPYIYADPSKFRKININKAEFRDFIKHPYFTKETISKILKYRQQHGDFTDVRHIRRIRSLEEETGERIIEYLTVE